MKAKLQSIINRIREVLLTYPAVLAVSLTMSLSIIYAIEFEKDMDDYFLPLRITLTCALGISLMFGTKMLAQRIGKEIWLHLAAFTVLGIYFWMLPSSREAFDDWYVFVIFPATVLSHLFVSFIPFTGKQSEPRFWEYNKNLFVNFFLTVVFTGVLTLGVMLAILAVEHLFDLEIKGDRYSEVFALLSIFGSTLIFLLFNSKGLHFLETESKYPVVLKFFTQFILIPLLLIYVVILYFYSGKILIKWELPEGWVSYLILAYSILGILALLLVHPLKAESSKSWVRIFSRAFYILLFPLLILLFTAIFTRVLEYGFTEARYFVLLLALWLTLLAVYFTFFRKSTIKFVPVSLFLLGLCAMVFPFFNVYSVAIRSQKQELNQLISQNKLLKNGKIDFEKRLKEKTAEDIADKIEFLSRRDQHEYLLSLVDTVGRPGLKNLKNWYVEGLFRNRILESENNSYQQLTASSKQYDVSDFDYALTNLEKTIKIRTPKTTSLEEHQLKLRNNAYDENFRFELILDDSLTVDLAPKIKKMFEESLAGGAEEVPHLSADTDLGPFYIRIYFNFINKRRYPDRDEYYCDPDMILVKRR